MEQEPFNVGDRIELQSEGWTPLVGTVIEVSQPSGTIKGRMLVVELQPAPQLASQRSRQPQRLSALA